MSLERGSDLIIEATFLWSDDVRWIETLVARYSPDLYQIWMTADPAVARERFLYRANNDARHPGHNDHFEQVIEEFDERFFQETFPPLTLSGKTLVVDTTDFKTVKREDILKFLEESV